MQHLIYIMRATKSTTETKTPVRKIDPILTVSILVLADESCRWICVIQLSSAHDRNGTGGDVGPVGEGALVGSTSNSVLDIAYQSLHSGQYPVYIHMSFSIRSSV